MARPIQVEVDVKSAAAIGAFAGIAQSAASAGFALVQAGIEAGIEAIGDSIALASDKAEAASKVNVLFADSADRIHDAAMNAATTVGMSSGAYETAAGNLGNLLKNTDLTSEAIADMSVDMIQLAADVGSFNNADPTDVVEAMGAAFRGESEPIRRFGVTLDEAAIKAKAMEMGLINQGEALDATSRAQAVYSLILDQTAAAQGDFARTADGLANSQRINAAKMEEAWTRVGEKLMPIAQKIMPILADALVGVVDGIGDVIDAIGEWVDENQPLVDQIIEIGRLLFDVWLKAWGAIIDVLGELGYRVGGVIGLFIDLGGAIIDTGDAILRLFAGDFEGAAAAGERALQRLQGFQENVQRAMGDTGRRIADEAAASFGVVPDAADEAMSTTINTLAGGYAAMANDPRVDRAADDLAGTLPDALDDSTDEAVRIAAKTPGEIASALRDHRSSWRDALDQLGDDMKNSMDRTKEIAQLEAALTGKKLAAGLNSSDPIVAAQAAETAGLIRQRLSELEDPAYGWGAKITAALARGLKSNIPEVTKWARMAATQTALQLKLGSPAKEGPWSEDGGPIEWMRRNGERMTKALGVGLNSERVRPPSLAFEGASSSAVHTGGRGITVNVYTGVGDPVAIGREVSEALRAYQRASGTEA